MIKINILITFILFLYSCSNSIQTLEDNPETKKEILGEWCFLSEKEFGSIDFLMYFKDNGKVQHTNPKLFSNYYSMSWSIISPKVKNGSIKISYSTKGIYDDTSKTIIYNADNIHDTIYRNHMPPLKVCFIDGVRYIYSNDKNYVFNIHEEWRLRQENEKKESIMSVFEETTLTNISILEIHRKVLHLNNFINNYERLKNYSNQIEGKKVKWTGYVATNIFGEPYVVINSESTSWNIFLHDVNWEDKMKGQKVSFMGIIHQPRLTENCIDLKPAKFIK